VQKRGVRNTQAPEASLNCRFITEIEFKLLFLKKGKKRKENKAAHLQKLLVSHAKIYKSLQSLPILGDPGAVSRVGRKGGT